MARSARRSTGILAGGLALVTVGAFLVEGLTGSRGALIAGNVAATLLGVLLLRRR